MLRPESNQIFPILPNTLIEKLKENFDFYIWEKHDKDNSVLRIVTSWATLENEVDKFLKMM
jgi:threonine aldolase